MRGGEEGYQMGGEFVPGNYVGRYGGEVEERNLGGGRGGNDGVLGDLVEDFGTWCREGY